MKAGRSWMAFAWTVGVAALVVCAVHAFRVVQARARRERARVEARLEACARLGLATDGRSPFVALAPTLVHHDGRAKLGRGLVADRRLASTRWRMCIVCHSPEKGGSDQKTHAGLLTRPLRNAVLGSVFLHDGSATNMAGAIRTMIEDPRFCAGGPLSNVVARLAEDERLVREFQNYYEEGLSTTNMVDAIEQYSRTLLTPRSVFDTFCKSGASVFDERQNAGMKAFCAHACVDCHDGPALGAMKVHGGKKVLGLRGLALRSVYLSDGSQTDLSSVLSLMPGGAMDENERAALLAFLKTL